MNEPLWSKDDLKQPHRLADKAPRVREMFDRIAPRYDLNNRLHSLGMDQGWRRALVRECGEVGSGTIVDVACGTGDVAILLRRANPQSRVVGVDFSAPMLREALIKSPAMHWACGDAMRLPLPDGIADRVTIAFGIRNVQDPAAALAEFARILRPGGKLLILEFAMPRGWLLRKAYNLYLRHVLPRTAALISRDRSRAYDYLAESVNTFLEPGQLLSAMRAAGLGATRERRLSLGTVCLLSGTR